FSFTVLAVGSLSAQKAQPKPADHQHDAKPAAAAPAAAEATPMIFCPTMKTGQLCSEGTATQLQMTGEKLEKWLLAVRTYNRAVNAATLQLQSDTKDVLTPAQIAEVERWFAIGLNPEINTLLAAPATPAPKAPAKSAAK